MTKYPAIEGGFVPPKKKVSTRFQKVQSDEQIKVSRRRASIPTFKSREISPLSRYILDNEGSDKSIAQLYEEFRADCGHQFVEVANLHKDSQRITFQTCKFCFIMVKGVGKPTPRNRIGNENGEES